MGVFVLVFPLSFCYSINPPARNVTLYWGDRREIELSCKFCTYTSTRTIGNNWWWCNRVCLSEGCTSSPLLVNLLDAVTG